MAPIPASVSERFSPSGVPFGLSELQGSPGLVKRAGGFASGRSAEPNDIFPGLGKALQALKNVGGGEGGDRLELRSLDFRYTHVQAMLRIEDGAKYGLKNGLYKLDIEKLQLRYRAISAYQNAEGAERGPAEAAETPDAESAKGKPQDDLIARLMEYFSPENTSDRIYQFAMQGYGRGSFTGPDDAAQRERFGSFILPHIEEGFARARAILGELPDDIAKIVDRTLDLVRGKFLEFAKSTESAEGREVAETTAEGVEPCC